MHIGYRDFVDGQTRPVYLDDDGNQYVIDDDGRPVYGLWIGPNTADVPITDCAGRTGRKPAPVLSEQLTS